MLKKENILTPSQTELNGQWQLQMAQSAGLSSTKQWGKIDIFGDKLREIL